MEQVSKRTMKEFNFYLEPKLEERLNRMVERLETQDVWIIIDGDEGTGKTNLATYLMYWFHCKINRPFAIENYHYDAEDLIRSLQNGSNLMANWDEGALGGLSKQWYTQAQISLVQFAMTGRVLHHIIIICIPHFEEFDRYIARQRSVCLLHAWKKNKSDYRFMYVNEKRKKLLYDALKKRNKAIYYNMFMDFGGFVPNVFDKVFTTEQQRFYDERKKNCISKIAPLKKDKKEEELNNLKYTFASLKQLTDMEKAKLVGITEEAIRKWRFRYKPLENSDFVPVPESNFYKEVEGDE